MASENSEKEVILLDLYASMFGIRARIALALKSVDYECREEDLLNNKSSLLLQMNPVHKKIPVLIHKNRPICESLNIVTYIDEAWGHKGPSILSKDPYLRAQARFWADYVDKKLYDAARKVWLTKDGGDDVAEAREGLLEVLRVLEKEIGGKGFFAGDDLGFADVALLGYFPWFKAYEKYGGFSVEHELPGISAWATRCLENKSVADALPDGERVIGFVQILRKHYGVD